MALTYWIQDKWVRSALDLLFDIPEFNLKADIKAKPLTSNHSLVGTAFDYAFRLQMAKHNSKLIKSFPLEVAAAGIQHNINRQICFDACKTKTQSYINGEVELDNNVLTTCIALAKLETIYRSGKEIPDDALYSADEADIEDLRNLVDLIDLDKWVAIRQCILNPTFRNSSTYIGGADADLIIDDTLIDIKTTKELKFARQFFRQLIGYHILNCREQELYKGLTKLGIYYARFGLLFKFTIPKMNRDIKYNDEDDMCHDVNEETLEEELWLYYLQRMSPLYQSSPTFVEHERESNKIWPWTIP